MDACGLFDIMSKYNDYDNDNSSDYGGVGG